MALVIQDELESMLVLHERFLKGLNNSRRLDLTMMKGRNLDFSKRILTEGDFVGAIMDGSCFVECQAQRANFFGSNLSRCSFEKADLCQADLRGAHMRAADFTSAVLTEANFGEGSLLRRAYDGDIAPVHGTNDSSQRMKDTVFRNASAERTRFSSAVALSTDLSFANFRGAKLSGVNFAGSNLRGVSFSQADLTNCNFNNTNMNSVILSGAILKGASFQGADLTASVIDRSDYGSGTFNDAKLPRNIENLDIEIQEILANHHLWIASIGRQGQQANLSGVNLAGAILNGVQLQAANLKISLLHNASFNNAIFSMADLSGCNACGSFMMKADCRGINFTEASLEEIDLREALCSPMSIMTGFSGAKPVSWPANFSQCSLRYGKLGGADLRFANFEGALLTHCDLRDANLEDAILVDADLTGADLRGANLDRADMRGAIGV
ncbi:MAG: pentapeptide repeat-containing protein [Bdellovibrionales bacterium]